MGYSNAQKEYIVSRANDFVAPVSIWRVISWSFIYSILTKRGGIVVSPATSYSGGLGLKSRLRSFVFPSVTRGKCRNGNLTLLPHSFNLLYSLIIRRYIVWRELLRAPLSEPEVKNSPVRNSTHAQEVLIRTHVDVFIDVCCKAKVSRI